MPAVPGGVGLDCVVDGRPDEAAVEIGALVGIALPLFIVTMASQNIPGYAVLGTFGYLPPFRPLLVATGFVSILLVAFVYAWKKGVLDWKS